jgi:bifunctional non-homologous end joining protein LigD
MLWDRGTFELLGGVSGAEQLARGDLKFRLHGEKLNGDFALVHMKGRGKGNDWLIIKKRDQFATPDWDVEAHAASVLSGRTQQEIAQNLPARKRKRKTAGAADRVWKSSRPAARVSAKAAAAAQPARTRKRAAADWEKIPGARAAEMPAALEPMTATLAGQPPRGSEWLFEVKWDGVRAIAFIENEEVRLTSRSGVRSERQYPELAVIPHQVAAARAVLDGEIAVLDSKGVSQFHLIQPRISNTDPNTVAHLARSHPAIYFVFDLSTWMVTTCGGRA